MTISSNYPNLVNAPIEEAIISLTIGVQKHSSLEELEKICAELQKTYPKKKQWKIHESLLNISNESVNMSHRQLEQGYILSTEDQKKIVHLSQDTLSFNRLRPYGSWDDFAENYKAAWDIFTEPLTIEEIKGITIRYINNFTIPTENWEEYLLMRPNLQTESAFDDSTISMGEVFSRYILVSERHTAESVVLLTLRPEKDNQLRVIMDIEVHSKTNISNYSGYHSITDALNRLRDFKNQIFFSNVPKAEELFS